MNRDIDIIAGLITEDPNHSAGRDRVMFEWFWKGIDSYFKDPLEKMLAPLIDKEHVKRFASARGVSWEVALRESMDGLKSEFQSFVRNFKITDPRQGMRVFSHWKQTGSMPKGFGDRDVSDLDARGGEYNPGGQF